MRQRMPFADGNGMRHGAPEFKTMLVERPDASFWSVPSVIPGVIGRPTIGGQDDSARRHLRRLSCTCRCRCPVRCFPRPTFLLGGLLRETRPLPTLAPDQYQQDLQGERINGEGGREITPKQSDTAISRQHNQALGGLQGSSGVISGVLGSRSSASGSPFGPY